MEVAVASLKDERGDRFGVVPPDGCDYSLRLLNQWRSRLLQNELGIWTGSGKGSIRLSPSGTFRGGHNLRDDLA